MKLLIEYIIKFFSKKESMPIKIEKHTAFKSGDVILFTNPKYPNHPVKGMIITVKSDLYTIKWFDSVNCIADQTKHYITTRSKLLFSS
jgi:hypothetical protein